MDFSLARCLAVWSTTTVAAAVVARWATADVPATWSGAGGPSFDVLVAALAGLALAGCATWGWVASTVVILDAVRERAPQRTGEVRAIPRWLQRLVLAACGVAILGSTTVGPAVATPGHITVAEEQTGRTTGASALAGLPLPDRTTGPLRSDRVAEDPQTAPERRTSVTVRPGDSLWSIATDLLDAAADTTEIAALTRRLHESNRALIGDDPDLIHPGHQLRTPLGERPDR